MTARAISRSALAASLAAIAVLAATPFVVATVVSERRIDEAATSAREIAGSLELPAAGAALLIGSGNAPDFDGQEWPDGSADIHMEIQPDPWQNAYLVNAGAKGPIWVLSAGPNGIVETPYHDAVRPAGDDIGVQLR